ncbi:MAG: transcription termination factor Rho, partial [Solirubrobacterales bacterium]|nr:transcription termination factor Rho [Solirubrobacterales bacterium]
MAVLERSDLEASPLADLHAIADQLGLDGFRRLRKDALIDAILDEPGGAEAPQRSDSADADEDEEVSERPETAPRARRRRPTRSRRSSTSDSAEEDDAPARAPAARERTARPSGARSAGGSAPEEASGRTAEGVVEVLGNGSAFLRVDPPEPSDEDVYISAAQVRRCELVSGDRVTGPVRTPRRSERYPSLVRIDTINGASSESVSDGTRYDELPVAFPSERLALGSKDPTLEAIEWLTPLGRGSRAVIVGDRQSGKTETLRRMLEAVHGREELEVSVVLAGARPEE